LLPLLAAASGPDSDVMLAAKPKKCTVRTVPADWRLKLASNGEAFLDLVYQVQPRIAVDGLQHELLERGHDFTVVVKFFSKHANSTSLAS